MGNINTGNAKLLVLDGQNGKILSFDTDGKNMTVILDDCGGTPDGIAADPMNRHIYWTNMGEHYDQNDGYIERINFNGTNRKVIIPKGSTFTPKQLKLDLKNKLLYWCDREGIRVMRSNMDGTNITTLIVTGNGDDDRKDEKKHCVGIAIDIQEQKIYWTQKGSPKSGEGRIFRAGLDIPAGADASQRDDVELLWHQLPEPIDLDINHVTGELYWTDRGAPPNGNTLNRASIINAILPAPEVLVTGLREAIGLALDIENERVFFVDLGGNLYCCNMDGSNKSLLYTGDGRYTGITYLSNGLM
jgi:hypothetical protein